MHRRVSVAHAVEQALNSETDRRHVDIESLVFRHARADPPHTHTHDIPQLFAHTHKREHSHTWFESSLAGPNKPVAGPYRRHVVARVQWARAVWHGCQRNTSGAIGGPTTESRNASRLGTCTNRQTRAETRVASRTQPLSEKASLFQTEFHAKEREGADSRRALAGFHMRWLETCKCKREARQKTYEASVA